jgi:predicted TIM-barrel fold metal-dependent hydrolase
MMLAQEYGVQHKLLFGTDYPFTTPEATLQALHSMNDMTKGTNLPKFDRDAIEGIINRDSLKMLGIA